MFFDGSRSNEGAGACGVLIDPKGIKTMIACRLEFESTNNVTEYKDFVQGLRKDVDMGAKAIECVGDSKIIVK